MALRILDVAPTPLAALAASPLLAALAPADLTALAAFTDRVELPSGAVVVREGDASGDMYFVLSGEARLSRNGLALKPLGPGGHFGALGLLTVSIYPEHVPPTSILREFIGGSGFEY